MAASFLTNPIYIGLFLSDCVSVNVVCNTGKAVFCEKPISQEESGTRACYEQAEKANKPLLCSFNRYLVQ